MEGLQKPASSGLERNFQGQVCADPRSDTGARLSRSCPDNPYDTRSFVRQS